MIIKDTREYFLNLYEQLSYLGQLKGARFTFAVSKNKQILQVELDKIREMSQMTAEYKVYEAERVAINKKYAEKDSESKPIIENKNYKITNANKKAFEKEMAELKEKNKDLIEAREKQSIEIAEYARAEILLDLKSIPLKFIPEDITVDQMDILAKLIQE